MPASAAGDVASDAALESDAPAASQARGQSTADHASGREYAAAAAAGHVESADQSAWRNDPSVVQSSGRAAAPDDLESAVVSARWWKQYAPAAAWDRA